MPTTIVARLDDKVSIDRHSGEEFIYVMCGRKLGNRFACGGRLARVFSIPLTDDRGKRRRAILVEPEYVQDEKAVFRLKHRAKKVYQRDRWRATGNPGTPDWLADDARVRVRNRWHPSARRLRDERGLVVRTSGRALYWERLPVEIQCPDCLGVNRLEPALADAPEGHDPFERNRVARHSAQ